jgi:hypothetical protein
MTDPQPLNLGRCDFHAELFTPSFIFYWELKVTLNGKRRILDGKERTLVQCAEAAQARIAELMREAVA